MRPRKKPTEGMLAQYGGIDARQDGKFTEGMAASLKSAINSIISTLNGGLTFGAGGQSSSTGNFDGYCVAPQTRILTSDLRWVEAGSVVAGDVLAGFDEHRTTTGKRWWKAAVVEVARPIVRPAYRLTLDDGTVVTASDKHLWLVPWGGTRKWRTTESLEPGASSLARVLDVWETDDTFGGGYVAAAFDGEGSLFYDNKGTLGLTFAQKENGMLARIDGELTTRRIGHAVYAHREGMRCLKVGRKHDLLRLIGSVRPVRLLPKIADPGCWGGIMAFRYPKVVAKEFVGDTEVVMLQTDARTYIAEGLMSHNCKDVIFPSVADTEMRVLHELGRAPRFFIVAMKDRAGDVYVSSYSSWGTQAIFLKSSVADLTATLLIF